MESQELNLEIPDSGAVFAFGKGAPGRFHIKSDSVISAACGEGHALVATSSGRLFAFGQNDYGQLGLGHKQPGAAKPACVKRLKELGQRAVRVACGPTHSLVTTEAGGVYGCGNNADGQLTGPASDHVTLVEIPHLAGKEVKDLAAGRSFSLVLTKQGEVFAWGSNSEGCLGCGPEVDELRDSLALVQLPEKAVALSAGAYHCACVLASGQVWAWGESEGGKLGVRGSEEKDYHYKPQLVPLPAAVGGEQQPQQQPKARAVSCGLQHTLVLTDAGRVLACGTGDSGQLGLGAGCGYADCLRPLQALEDLEIMGICAGERHSVCVSATGGHLYTFGDALHGKLGPSSRLGGHSNQHRPFRVAALKPVRVRRAVCGTLMTLVLAVPRPPNDPALAADAAAAGEAEEDDDDPLDAMSAKSPKPLGKMAAAAAAAVGVSGEDGGSSSSRLLRRRSTRSREKFRESVRESSLLASSSGDFNGGGATFDLVRPAMKGTPEVSQQPLTNSKKLGQSSKSSDNKKAHQDYEDGISKFDQLLQAPNGTDEGEGEDIAEVAATEQLLKPRLDRRPSETVPTKGPENIEPMPAEVIRQADQTPEEAPVLIETATTVSSEAPPPPPPSETPLVAAEANDDDNNKRAEPAPAAAAAAAAEAAAEEGDGTSAPVKAAGCGRRRQQRGKQQPLPPPAEPPEETEAAAAASDAPAEGDVPATAAAAPTPAVTGVGCGRGRRRRRPEVAAAAPDDPVAAEAVAASGAAEAPTTAESQEQPPQEEPPAASQQQGADPVKGVGCGRSRKPPPPTQTEPTTPPTTETAEAEPAAPEAEAEAAPAAQPEGGSSGEVSGVGCGRGRRRKPPPTGAAAAAPPEEQPQAATTATTTEAAAPPPAEGSEPGTTAQEAAAAAEGDAGAAATPDAAADAGGKKSRSCAVL